VDATFDKSQVVKNATKPLVIVSAVLAAAAIAFHVRAMTVLRAEQRELAVMASHAVHDAIRLPEPDFVQRLGPPITAEALAAELARLTTSGVSLSGFTATPRDATTGTLGRVEVQLNLHGSYTNIKLALADLLDRHPDAVLTHLSLRRTASDDDAQITLWLLSPPLAKAGG
jgi:hypothetical protein